MKVTAPGKVLLLGGYAVLESFPALTLAVSDSLGLGVTALSKEGSNTIISRSFNISKKLNPNNCAAEIKKSKPGEKIAVTAYCVASAYLIQNGYRIKDLDYEISNSHIFGQKNEKSGLGSSAAATAAIVGCILKSNGVEVYEEIHKLAQISHSLATKKIGSGVDIATSVYGSIKYNRYPKETLEMLSADMDEDGFAKELSATVKSSWKMEIKPFNFAPYKLLVFNVKKRRTSTVSAVGFVAKLKNKNPALYNYLISEQVKSEALVFDSLKKQDNSGIMEGMHGARSAQAKLSEAVCSIDRDFDSIEPLELTKLIDQSEQIEGVIAGRCPGSGGYDSICFVVEPDDVTPKILSIAKGLGLNIEYIDCKLSLGGLKTI